MATGDSGREAYTAIAWGVGLSHERSDIAGAEGFHSLEGNMCGTARRGADALPRSKATSRAKGSHRNLGDLVSGRRRRVLCVYGGPHWEGEEPKPMMHGHEKSDLVSCFLTQSGDRNGAACRLLLPLVRFSRAGACYFTVKNCTSLPHERTDRGRGATADCFGQNPLAVGCC